MKKMIFFPRTMSDGQVKASARASFATVLVLSMVALSPGCESNDSAGNPGSKGGSSTKGGSGGTAIGGNIGGSTSMGGRTSVTGGTVGAGGDTSKGGTTSAGGRTDSGGTPSQGGATSTGGTPSTGGSPSAGGAPNSGGTPSAGGSTGTGLMLPQEGNPINTSLDTYKEWIKGTLDADKKLADNIVSWQLASGGYYKWGVAKYSSPGQGSSELGTIDNDATTTELMVLADVYNRSKDVKYQSAARKTFDYLLTMQTSTGGWPQYYPKRGNYSDHVTFNDNAMVRVLVLLDRAVRKEAPLDGDIFTEEQVTRAATAVNKGVEYILKSQIKQDGVPTVWCAQHGVDDYLPKAARDYELASKSGSESVLVAAFLMSRPQTDEVKKAVKAAVDWFRNPATYLKDTAYEPTQTNPIVSKPGSNMWFRFYDLDKDKGFFCGRDGVKKYDVMEIEAERRSGYRWGGPWGEKLITYAVKVGY